MNKTFALAAVFVAVLSIGFADRGHAAIYPVASFNGNVDGIANLATPLNVGDSMSWSHLALTAPYKFEDRVGFTMSGTGVVGGAAKFEFKPLYGFDDFFVKLYTGTTGSLGTLVAQSAALVGDDAVAKLTAYNLTAGSYVVMVEGKATGTASNVYSGSMTVVPVPAALPLMLTALAGLGLIGRRRMQADA